MRSALRSTYHSALTGLQTQVQYASHHWLGIDTGGCDAQSTCASTARKIMELIHRKKHNSPHQNSRIREEIMSLLDHEKLLSLYGCHALALLTTHETMRQLIISCATREHIRFLESIQLNLRENYIDRPLYREELPIQEAEAVAEEEEEENDKSKTRNKERPWYVEEEDAGYGNADDTHFHFKHHHHHGKRGRFSAQKQQLPVLEILIPKHLGHGMKYLKALKKHNTGSSD